jgi:tetratricopeptide (TPR) repeat protein
LTFPEKTWHKNVMKKKFIYLIIILLIAASCFAFGRISGNDFINFDDNIYITGNNHIQSGINYESIKWAFTAVVSNNWHPLTLISHALGWSLFGANPSGHHIVSMFLHIGSVILLFLFLNKTTGNLWAAAFAAAFFALHPLRVESVAWAAERKDVLSMFFGMAAIYAYSFYAEKQRPSKYLLCLIFFAMALMSKPMMVTLPFVLMLLDYWPLKRWQKAIDDPRKDFNPTARLIWEKVPFICLTIVSSIVTFWTQSESGSVSLADFTFLTRSANATISYVSYLEKIFWPVNLAVFYPFNLSLPLWKVLTSGLILILITLTVIYYIRKLPFLFTGWFLYLGTLVPVIGLVQIGNQAMADRYTYLPSVGIALMLTWGIPLLFPNENTRKKILLPAAIAVIAILSVLTWRQCGYWKNSATLFIHALQVTKNNYLAHNNLGITLFDEKKNEEAIDHFSTSISIKEDYHYAYNNRGFTYAKLGQYQRALDDYNKAISLFPDYITAYSNRGIAYYALGYYQNAIEDFNKAIALRQDYADNYNNRGTAYYALGYYQQAIGDFNKAISLKEDFAEACKNRGIAYYTLGYYQNAIGDFNKAIILKPDYAEAYNNRATVYLNQGNKESGCFDAQKACMLGICRTLDAARAKGLCH